MCFLLVLYVCDPLCVCVYVCAIFCAYVFAMFCMKMFVNFLMFCFACTLLICIIMGICAVYVFVLVVKHFAILKVLYKFPIIIITILARTSC